MRISYSFTLLTDMQRDIAFHSVTDLPQGGRMQDGACACLPGHLGIQPAALKYGK
jgi:hypothetical protein